MSLVLAADFFYLWGIREEAPYGFSSLIFILQRNYFFSFHFKQEKTGSEFTSIRSLVSIRSSDSNSVCSESGDRCAKYPPPKTHVNWKTHTHTHTHTQTKSWELRFAWRNFWGLQALEATSQISLRDFSCEGSSQGIRNFATKTW